MRRTFPLALIVAFVAACGTSTVTTQPSTPPTTADVASESTSTPETVTATPMPEDFQLRVKTLKQECFGSAGCNVTFTIRVSYSGALLSDDAERHVTYKVTGGEEPLINTFTITGDQATVTEEEFISTSSSTAKLKAKVTEIE